MHVQHAWFVICRSIDVSMDLVGAGEVGGTGLAALVEKQHEVDGDVELDAKNVGLDGCAEAHGCVEVGEAA